MIIIFVGKKAYYHAPINLSDAEERVYSEIMEKFSNNAIRAISVPLDPACHLERLKSFRCDEITSIELR